MSLTVIARIVQIDIINEVQKGKKLRPNDYANIIKDRFEWISEEEKDVSLPPLQPVGIKYSSSIAGLPFPVSRPPGAFVNVKGYDDTTGRIKDIDPAAYVIEVKDDEDVETRYYDPTIDK